MHIAAVKFGSPHAFLPLQFVIFPIAGIFLLHISTLDVNLYFRVFKTNPLAILIQAALILAFFLCYFAQKLKQKTPLIKIPEREIL